MKSNLSAKIIVAVLPMLSIMELNTTSDSRLIITGGLEGTGVLDIMDALGMEYEVVVPSDGEYGKKKRNGDWTGLVGMTMRGEADIAFGALGINAERLEVVDFTKPLLVGYMTFAIGRAGKFRPKNAYLYPFHFPVWACFTFLFFVMAAAMWLVFENKYSIGRVVFELYGVTLRQSFTLGVGSWKSKFFVAAIFLYGFVMTSGYSGVLLSFMTVAMEGKTVETFQELSDAVVKGTHRCHVDRHTPIVPYLISTKEKHLHKLGIEIFKNKWYLDRDDSNFVSVISPNDAVVGHNLILEMVYGRPFQSKQYLISKEGEAIGAYGIAMNRKFCYKKKLNKIVTSIWESGLVLKYAREASFDVWLNSTLIEEEKEHRISIEDISAALIILCAGYVIAFLTLLTEILYFKYA